MEAYDLPFEFKAARDQFDTGRRLSQRVYGQNVRGEGLEEIVDPDFQAMAHEGLADEQRDTITELRNLAESAPYEAVALAELELSRQIGRASVALKEGEERLESLFEAIDADYERAKSIAPQIADKILALAEEKKLQKEIEITGVDRKSYIQAQRQYASLLDLYNVAGEAWPVPRLLSREPAVNAPVDQVPAVAEERSEIVARSEDSFAAFLRRQHIEKPTASHYAAYYIASRPGEIVSIDDLGKYLVAQNQTSDAPERKLRNRISTMLAPHSHGARVQAMLHTEGLMLQYGTVTPYGEDGQPLPIPPRRAYRALAITDPEAATGREFSAEVTHEPVNEPAVTEPVQETDAAAESTEPKSWQGDLADKVERAIAELESDGLMSGDEAIPITTVRIKSSSKKIGTRESVTRLARARLLPPSVERTPDAITLRPAQMVLMHVFNSTPQLKRRENRLEQREAAEIVDRLVSQYFAAK